MKKNIFILSVFLCVSSMAFGQRNSIGRAIVYETDIFGNLKYERDGFKATLSENIFDDINYEDNRGNKLTYKKKFLDRLNANGKHDTFRELLRYFRDKEGVKEVFEVDIFDKLKYSNNQGFKASLGKNIFEDVIYEDSNDNKITFKKKFLDIFRLPELASLDVYLFMDMLYSLQYEKNYKEEYDVDIFDYVKYSSSDGTSIKIEKEQAIKMFDRKRRRNSSIWRELF